MKDKKFMVRHKTKHPGVYYRVALKPGTTNEFTEVYYIEYRIGNKKYEERVGRKGEPIIIDGKPLLNANKRKRTVSAFQCDKLRDMMIACKYEPKSVRLKREKEEKEKRKTEKAKLENRMTIDRLWEEYRKVNDHKPSFPSDVSRYNNHIKDTFGDKEPHELDSWKINKSFQKDLQKKGFSPATVHHVLELLRRLVNFGEDNGKSKGFGFKMKMPRVNNQTTEHLTPEQLRNLLNAIEKDKALHPISADVGRIMKFALFTGMRKGEIFKLKWTDIDYQTGFIHIREPKGGKDERIPLNNGARKVLEEQPKTDSPYVFPGRDGKKRTDITKQVNRIKEEAKLPEDFRPVHGLRHAYASMLASSGEVDLYTLQKLLTHKSSKTTQRYAYLVDEALKRGSDVVDDIIDGAINGS